MIGMICRSCCASDTQLEKEYAQWMLGEGMTYREIQRVRLQCLDCGEEMVTGLLAVNW